MRRHKISLEKVQRAFNDAIKRRDCRCMIKDFEPCYGQLECSHFYTVGGSPAIRFYPPNAYAQCSKHHWNHHTGKVPFYRQWMNENHQQDYIKMERIRNKFIYYSDELKTEIIRLCNEDKLMELQKLIEEELGK